MEENNLKPTPATGRKMQIAGDIVNRATSELPDRDRIAIRWLHHHGMENDMSLEELAAKIKRKNGEAYDRNTLYKILTGRHEAKLDNAVQAIEDYRALMEKRQSIRRLNFIETQLSKKMWQVCETALTYQKINFIIGDSQIGKTTAVDAYAKAHNHGETILVRMPTGGAITLFLEAMAAELKINTHLREAELRRRIIRAFDDRMLLIVDEIHQVFIVNATANRIRTIEFIRELHDRTQCGVVLVGTNVFSREIQTGKHKDMLKQLSLRSLATLNLPPKPTRRDLAMIAKGYHLDFPAGEALELQDYVIRDSGLGKWCTYLQAGSRIASKASEELDWKHVLKADAALHQLQQLETKNN